MIISIDGNVNSGKTTMLCNYIAHNIDHAVYIPEHSDLLRLVTHNGIHHQSPYLDTEALRAKMAEKSIADLVLVDRSFISIFAHTIATTPNGHQDRQFITMQLSRMLLMGESIVPNHFIFLKCKYHLSLLRYIKCFKHKSIPLQLLSPIYQHRISEVYKYWIKEVGGIEISPNSSINFKSLSSKKYNKSQLIETMQRIAYEF